MNILDGNDVTTLNNTAEEQMRRKVIELSKQIQSLSNEVELLKRNIKAEEEQKRKAWIRIHELITENNQLKELSN